MQGQIVLANHGRNIATFIGDKPKEHSATHNCYGVPSDIMDLKIKQSSSIKKTLKKSILSSSVNVCGMIFNGKVLED